MVGEDAYLDEAISRYSPQVAATARAALKKLRAATGIRAQAVAADWLRPCGARRGRILAGSVSAMGRFFFLEGVAIDDPEGRLEGSGSQVRSIRVDERAAILDDPYIRGLMAQALEGAGVDLKTGSGHVVLKAKIP